MLTVSVRLIKGLIFLKFIAIIVILITLARMMLLLALFGSLLEKLKDLRLASDLSSLCVFLQVKMVKGSRSDGAEAIPMGKNNVRLQMRLVHNNFASFILMEQPKHTTNERKTTISEFYAILLKRILILSYLVDVVGCFDTILTNSGIMSLNFNIIGFDFQKSNRNEYAKLSPTFASPCNKLEDRGGWDELAVMGGAERRRI
ncbi:hypothetical protein DY000_02009673 [Brassica cretica]|uniref:Uncharacterized protein n=1 Tax=Brassica cretica TaxID=69181 RepID=A0ABQ7BXT2_BRACR|nr:hypothetical protein DY000_02009673 [Brassica cretica]